MSKSNVFEADVLKLIFQGVAIANLADNASVGAASTLTIALHTSDPGEAGDQTTNETSYTGYSRVAVARSPVGFAVSGTNPTTINPVGNIDFPICTASAGGAIKFFSIGTGVGNKMLYSGTVTPNIAMAVNVIPRLTTDSTVTED